MDQGSPLVAGPCASLAATRGWDLHMCSEGYDTGAYPKGPGRPVAGQFADPQLFVAESRDADSEDRNVSPVKLTDLDSGVTDLLVGAMDHGWCFGYTCQKRLSTFWSVVGSGGAYSLNFTGTPPRVLRIWFPYADPDADLVVHINFFVPDRRFIWVSSCFLG